MHSQGPKVMKNVEDRAGEQGAEVERTGRGRIRLRRASCGHATGSWLHSRRQDNYRVFEWLLRYHSRHVVAMDAHLSDRTLEVLHRLRGPGTHLVRNTHTRPDDRVLFCHSDDDALGRMLELLDQGERVVVTHTCAVQDAVALEQTLKERYPDKTGLLLCSKTPQLEKDAALANPSETFKVDYLIYTSTVGAGVSFEEDWFHSCFCFLSTQSCDGADGPHDIEMRVADLPKWLMGDSEHGGIPIVTDVSSRGRIRDHKVLPSFALEWIAATYGSPQIKNGLIYPLVVAQRALSSAFQDYVVLVELQKMIQQKMAYSQNIFEGHCLPLSPSVVENASSFLLEHFEPRYFVTWAIGQGVRFLPETKLLYEKSAEATWEDSVATTQPIEVQAKERGGIVFEILHMNWKKESMSRFAPHMRSVMSFDGSGQLLGSQRRTLNWECLIEIGSVVGGGVKDVVQSVASPIYSLVAW